MSLRTLTRVFVMAAMLTSADVAVARTICFFDGFGNLCTSSVDISQFVEEAQQSQFQSQWCWAASISMVFAFHGYPVNQTRIVTEVYGSAVNMPALYGGVISEQLNRSWEDDFGQRFTSRLSGLYDLDAGVVGISNDQIIRELDQDNPIVYGAGNHAMVLTSVQYYQTLFGPSIQGGTVYDPWPGFGFRQLQASELFVPPNGTLRYIATARLTEGDEGGSSGSIGIWTILFLVATGLVGWIRRVRQTRAETADR